ncbi:MAG: hypothetical protein JO360_04330 [Acidobacteria bacterium]|nr:hypothetical protein [Acidobacteriota bacterium]
MFCPNCGAAEQSADAYCKRCGEWLPELKARKRRGLAGATPEQKLFKSLFLSALSAASALFSALALYLTYLGTDEGKWSVYFAAAFCLCIAFWQTFNLVIGLQLRQRLKRGRTAFDQQAELEEKREQPSLKAADTAQFATPSSVTEATTDLLEPLARKSDRR